MHRPQRFQRPKPYFQITVALAIVAIPGEVAAVVRKVLGADGKSKATMPSDDPGAVAGDDLAKILVWADAFDRTHAGRHADSPKESPHAH